MKEANIVKRWASGILADATTAIEDMKRPVHTPSERASIGAMALREIKGACEAIIATMDMVEERKGDSDG